MKNAAMLIMAGLALGAAGSAKAVTDVVEAPTDFFVPSAAQVFDSPYYRGAGEDWGWTHGAIASGFTSAILGISAYDVDDEDGEVDDIYAYSLDTSSFTLLGSLVGDDSEFSYTEFTLGADWFDEISAGLQIFMDIDVGNDGWFVTLSKSALVTDGSTLPPPDPGVVPLPAAAWMLIAGLGALGATRLRRKH